MTKVSLMMRFLSDLELKALQTEPPGATFQNGCHEILSNMSYCSYMRILDVYFNSFLIKQNDLKVTIHL